MKFTIKEQLAKQNLSVYWLAKESGVSYSYMDNIIKNKTNSIKLDTLEQICILLKCTPNDIIEIEE